MVIDGDMVLLMQQEYFLQERKSTTSWKTAYQLPTSADRLVIEFRNWFDRYCHGQLPWNEVGINVPPTSNINSDRQQILDRYKQHTQHCRSCREALLVVQRLQAVLLIYFVITVCAVALLRDQLQLMGLPGNCDRTIRSRSLRLAEILASSEILLCGLHPCTQIEATFRHLCSSIISK
jgi:hypothetical protein